MSRPGPDHVRMKQETENIVIDRRGAAIVVTLDRPRALNALTLEMCEALLRGLGDWADDPEVGLIVARGAGERAYCAGGDIRKVRDVLITDGIKAALRFFATEYRMNARLHHLRKPWVALLDGIVMGGGVGISIHGRFRVATGRTRFAMPETGIGFFPDVGGTWALPRLPGQTGLYLGLTGRQLGPADCLALGIATHVIEAERLPEIEDALCSLAPGPDLQARVQAVLDGAANDPRPGELAPLRERIDACFGGATLDDVFGALRSEPSGFGAEVLAELAPKSPMSLAVTFEQLRRGRRLASFDDGMRLEYRLVRRFLEGHDFQEGVRALLVDKDRRPHWQPARLDQVSRAAVENYFAPLPEGELELDHPADRDGGRRPA